MNAMDTKEFEKYLKKTVKQIGLESPSMDFTNAVMSKVQKTSVINNITTYKPLISKYVWYFLMVLVMVVFTFLLYGNQFFGMNWFSGADSNWLALDTLLGKVPTFTISPTVVYSFIILAIFMSVQIVLLKHHFDKRIA